MTKNIRYYIETSRFVFAQSTYLSLRASKSNLDGAQEPEHALDFSLRVLDIEQPGIITDASAKGMRLIQENLERTLKVQKEYYTWRNKQNIIWEI